MPFALPKILRQSRPLLAYPVGGAKSAHNLASTAQRVASEGVSLARFIHSLGIRYAGKHSSKILATVYGNVNAFLAALEEASQIEQDSEARKDKNSTEEEETVAFAVLSDKDNDVNKGIGPTLISSLQAFSREKELVLAAKDLAAAVKVLDDEDYSESGVVLRHGTSKESQEGKPFFGMKIVFTGSLASSDLTRTEAQALAKSMGAVATPSTISKATDLVVVGEKGGGKKLDRARDLGVKTMELEEFARLVEEFQGEDGT